MSQMMALRGRLVQMPVPPVRPLLRRTIKRLLRLLPSVLLLLFVVSLIFVTLMQIAVIHTHRRLQRNSNSISSANSFVNSTLNPNHGLIESQFVTTSTQSNPLPKKVMTETTKKAEVLRIEALLDKNLPSIEANTHVIQNFINSGRIRQIIDFALNPNVSSIVESYDKTLVMTKTNNSVVSSSVVSSSLIDDFSQTMSLTENINETETSIVRFANSYTGLNTNHINSNINESDFQINTNVRIDDKSYVKHKLNSSLNQNEHKYEKQLLVRTKPIKPMCSSVPPNLFGRVRVHSHIHIDENMSQIVRMNPDLQLGGSWEPKDCHARHRVAIIIPYRDRRTHLAILLYHLHPILKRQLLSYRIYVIEQFGSDTFNKGVLMNAGVREALKENDFHCFVFHDVDLIPEDDRNLYSCPFAPRHMSVAVDKFNYSLPYKDLVGGVLSITKNNFILVNGYSNLYWGWGGEDDDLAHRLKYHNLHIIRPPESIGRYTMIKHHHRPESPNNVRSALLRMARRRALRDGLGSVRYKVIFKHEESCFTHIMVEIGHIHKWHFPSPNKLVLHFR